MDWTPVNEPLTTARFSGLYGLWFPHGRDEPTFARAFINQMRGTVLAMRAIREVVPDARLIQTEDLGKTWSTPALAYQADFENVRRFLTFDLLSGRMTGEDHRMWGHLRWAGVPEADLLWFAENPCPPDVIGVNHYVTSERFLDERVERYPRHTHGSNGRHCYADVEAVRVLARGAAGPRSLLREVWERFRLPVAVTEAHLGCPVADEQIRWLAEVWSAAGELRDEEGADVRAVTVWALFGAFDWDSLLTRFHGRYESGVFAVRRGAGGRLETRPTALASFVRDLAGMGRLPAEHPALAEPGWWRRPERLIYPPHRLCGLNRPAPQSDKTQIKCNSRRDLIAA
jgi:dTDP-4-dehydrorhamnose reductase